MNIEYIKCFKRKRFPKIDGDFLLSNVHKCSKVFEPGIYKIELLSGKYKFFRIKSFFSIKLGPVYQVIEEIKDVK